MTQRQDPRPADTGLTLIELMLVLAVASILAALAWPGFQESVRKSRRSDAVAALAAISQAQERWRANNPIYQAELGNLPGANSLISTANHYALAMVDGSATGYTVTATARSASPQYADSRCRVLQLAVASGSISYSSLTSAGVVNPAPEPCWVK